MQLWRLAVRYVTIVDIRRLKVKAYGLGLTGTQLQWKTVFFPCIVFMSSLELSEQTAAVQYSPTCLYKICIVLCEVWNRFHSRSHSREKRPLTWSCPSVCTYRCGTHWTDFHEMWYWELSWKFVQKLCTRSK